ncbi:unnamed protein product [Ceratitis capitata]|uniref:(Mediterranean fruit fly) hypothetical protein n=1 Tax=Ceratitis capitata TaxID=7213 RepID=A0A811UK98_CERCA|nr:unnamed protein product [Ceratitis capitata]
MATAVCASIFNCSNIYSSVSIYSHCQRIALPAICELTMCLHSVCVCAYFVLPTYVYGGVEIELNAPITQVRNFFEFRKGKVELIRSSFDLFPFLTNQVNEKHRNIEKHLKIYQPHSTLKAVAPFIC